MSKLEIPSLKDCVKQIKEEGCNSLYAKRLELLMPPGLGVNHNCDPIQEAKDLVAEMDKQELKEGEMWGALAKESENDELLSVEATKRVLKND